MRHPPARCDGRGDLTPAPAPHWLLIGNSRWHWGWREGGFQGSSEPAEPGAERLLQLEPDQLVAWAAVGAVPQQLVGVLPELRRLTTAQVPLADAPTWLGVDRALAGWGAWRCSNGAPVLVADAGTAMSLTRVDGQGRFAGGRLLAGAGLQLRALGQGTTTLPALAAEGLPEAMVAGDRWPAATEQAMAVGVVAGLAAVLAAAAHELSDPNGPACQLWLTGGDGLLLAASLQTAGSQPWRLAPLLVLEALAELRPGPDP